MTQIILQNVGVSLARDLFQGVTLTLAEGDRLGIVGNNGAGKTTLLRCVAGTVEPTSGSITKPKKVRFGYAEQEVPAELEAMEMHAAIAAAIPRDEREAMEWRVDVVLDSFDTPEELRQRRVAQLSGGWRRLTLIARAWVSDPDILLLDEPTNHLDLEKILKLETWLAQEATRLPMMVVSHDRRFLDTCTNRTLFLRPRESVTFAYPFSKARELLVESDRALSNRKEKEQKEALRLRESAHKLRQIGVNNYSAAALRKSIQIAKRADAIEDTMTEVHVEPRREIKLTSSNTHAKSLVTLEGVTILRPDGDALFTIGKVDIRQGDRIALLGRNGTGKTCFVERLRRSFAARDMARDTGIRIAPSAVVGYVDQEMSQLPNDSEIWKYIAGFVDRDRATAVLVTAGFPIGQHNHKIDLLSLGQKARLGLLALQLVQPNFFLMDEPTNHVDIPGQEQLEDEILEHVTTGVIVSHDRAFVANIGTRFLVVENGKLFEIDTPEQFYDALEREVGIRDAATGVHPV